MACQEVHVKALGTVCSLVVAIGAGVAHADLLVDFNDRASPAATQDGWEPFVLPGATNVDVTEPTTANFSGGITVTVSRIGNTTFVLRDEVRTLDNPESVPQAQMLRDFVSARQNSTAVAGEGMNILVSGLTPNAQYDGRIWSWDPTQTLPASNFAADWSVNGTGVVDNWSLSRSAPTSNTDNSFAFSTVANASGQIVIQGVRDSASVGNPVLINGLQLTLVPEPASLALIGLGAACVLTRRSRS
jgi:hypothetical protein